MLCRRFCQECKRVDVRRGGVGRGVPAGFGLWLVGLWKWEMPAGFAVHSSFPECAGFAHEVIDAVFVQSELAESRAGAPTSLCNL